MGGSTIDVPIPSAVAATDVTASNTPPSPGRHDHEYHSNLVEQVEEVHLFHLTDKDMVELDENRHFASRCKSTKQFVVLRTKSTTTFSLNTRTSTTAQRSQSGGSIFSNISQINAARRLLNSENASPDNRRLVTNFVGEDAMLNLSDITRFNEVGGCWRCSTNQQVSSETDSASTCSLTILLRITPRLWRAIPRLRPAALSTLLQLLSFAMASLRLLSSAMSSRSITPEALVKYYTVTSVSGFSSGAKDQVDFGHQLGRNHK